LHILRCGAIRTLPPPAASRPEAAPAGRFRAGSPGRPAPASAHLRIANSVLHVGLPMPCTSEGI